MKFESTLAEKIASRRNGYKGWITIAGTLLAVFLVLNMASGSIAGDRAVIHVGSKSSVARYLGQFDGKSNVMMFGAKSSFDWVCVKIPFNGHLSDVKSVAFSEFVAQTGGSESLEPYIVLKFSEGKSLICNPVTSYSNGTWDLPLMEWQLRDAASKGSWTYSTPDVRSTTAPLATWIRTMGGANVLSVNLYIGPWSISSPYQCYVADLTINGDGAGFANAARCSGSLADLPPGY